MCRAGARFSGPGVAFAGATAAATTFGPMGGMGMGPIPPQYPLAFHHLAQTYMHAVWRQGLCHQTSTSSSSNSSSTSTASAVSLQTWNSADPAQQSSSYNAFSKSTKAAARALAASGSGSGSDPGKKTLTPAERMREYREKLKRNPEVYQRYKQMNALRSRLARMRRSQEQVERDREKARQRNKKYRPDGAPSPDDLDLMALAAEGSPLDFSLSSAVTPPPTHLLHEPPAPLPHTPYDDASLPDDNVDLPSCLTEEWEPPVSFHDASATSP